MELLAVLRGGMNSFLAGFQFVSLFSEKSVHDEYSEARENRGTSLSPPSTT